MWKLYSRPISLSKERQYRLVLLTFFYPNSKGRSTLWWGLSASPDFERRFISVLINFYFFLIYPWIEGYLHSAPPKG